jgi:hypothetical protein
MGLASKGAEAGDVVRILHGSKAPIVLRGLGRRYRVIGQCYWHDWTYGERVDWEENAGDSFSLI